MKDNRMVGKVGRLQPGSHKTVRRWIDGVTEIAIQIQENLRIIAQDDNERGM